MQHGARWKDGASLTGIATQHVGSFRAMHFHTGSVDPVADRVDLLIVGMPEISCASQIGGITCALDAALSGTLSHLRAGGVFEGRFGETLILSSPPSPVRSNSLLVVGMGDADQLDAARLGRLAAVAMRAAVQLDVRSMACLLGPISIDASANDVAQAAREMMIGVLGALDKHQDRRKVDDTICIFDLRTLHADIATDRFKAVLNQWDF
jgi:hypothetical protein